MELSLKMSQAKCPNFKAISLSLSFHYSTVS